jgi:aminomethyltransferase
MRYTLVTTDEGPGGWSVLDDALVGREADAADGTPRLALVVNASNRERVVSWLERHVPPDGVVLEDRTAATAMIAIQGPLAVAIVSGLAAADAAAAIGRLKPYRSTTAVVAGRQASVSRTGYTGEDGLELVVEASAAVPVWEALAGAGAARGLLPCGLGARDTLRLEAGMPLYGHELVATSDPFALGLGLAVAFETAGGSPRTFPGATALRRLRDAPSGRIRVGLTCAGRRAAREGSVITLPGREGPVVGVVTSGSFCPTLGVAAAQALVDRELADPGTPLDVHVRGAVQPAVVKPLPLYRRPAPVA